MSQSGCGHADRWPWASTGRLRAAHVVAGLDPAYGGPSYSVPRLCEALAAAGAETMVLSVATDDGGQRDVYDKGYRDCRFAWDYARIPMLRRLHNSQGLSEALNHAARTADVIHNHGLWLMPNVNAARAAASGTKPFVVSPRGMLAPAALAFSRAQKQVFWALLQGFRGEPSAVPPAFMLRANRNTRKSASSASPIPWRSSRTASMCPN